MAAEAHLIETIIGVGILLFAAKLMAELFLRLKLPIVLGELLAGMIVGPFALGQFFVIDGKQLLQINSEIKILGEMGAIVILFMAGLDDTERISQRRKAVYSWNTRSSSTVLAGLMIFGCLDLKH